MVQAMESVTIYNRSVVNGEDTYLRTVLRGVSWYSKDSQRSDVANGIQNASTYTVRVPTGVDAESKTYISPALWSLLSASDRAGYWTAGEGDKVVRGIVSYTIGVGGVAWSSLEELCSEVMLVAGCADNRRGPMPHLRIEGK